VSPGLRFGHEFGRISLHGDTLTPENRVREVASQGISGPAGPLPHLDIIQRSFGRHDVSGVKAHMDARALAANEALGAVGYTMGDQLAFAAAPDLRTVAHEAAHVVQQRKAGHPLQDGVGKTGDAFERHADAVGDLVTQGRSAEALLHACPTTSTPGVQRQSKDDPTKGTYKWTPTVPAAEKAPSAVPTYSGGAGSYLGTGTVTGTKTLTNVRDEIDGIGTKAQEQDRTYKGDVKSGIFATATFKVEIPIPEVPGLSVKLELEGKYARDKDGQELELKQSMGVEYSFFSIFTISAERSQYLKLEGESLGEAFIDALKQITALILREAGVEEKLAKLSAWSKLSKTEKAGIIISEYFTAGLLSPLILTPEILASMASPQQIEKAIKRYHDFFVDDPLVGFEAGIGGSVSAEAKAGGLEEKASAEAIVGIEDVDKKKATEFAEVAFSGDGKVGDSDLNFRLSKRWRADGSQQAKFELAGEFPGDLGLSDKLVAGIKVFLKSAACMSAFSTVSRSDKAGEGRSVDMKRLGANAALIIPILIPIKASKKKVGLDLSFENDVGRGESVWKAAARIKELQEFGNDFKAGNASGEIKLKYGTFIDISGEIQNFVRETYAPLAPASPRLQGRK
jgi:hypothetical protein